MRNFYICEKGKGGEICRMGREAKERGKVIVQYFINFFLEGIGEILCGETS